MNLRRVGHSLIFRLVAMGILLVAAGTTARYLLLTHFLRGDLEKVVSSQQLALADYVAREVDNRLVERREFLERLAASLPPGLLARPGDLRAWLAERHTLLPLFNFGLVATDASGRVLADFPEVPARAGAAFGNEPDFVAALGGKAVIGRPRVGPAVKKPILPMGAPIVRDGRVLGVLIGTSELGAAGFLDLLQMGRIGEGGGFLLISPRERLFVASSVPEMVMQQTPPAGVNPLHDRAMAGFRGTGITVSAKGVEELSAIASVPSTGWFVVARLPTAEAFATVSRAQAFLVRGFAIAFVFLVVVGSFLIWLALRQLFRAADHADRMTRGELPLAPLPVGRDDEVGYLTAAFNRLLGKLEQSQSALAHQASHDALTGLPNRTLLADNMRQARARAQRNGTRLAVLFMDLDGFKPINDRLGHEAGDEALRQVAHRLQDVVRTADTLARVGGDEFVVLAVDLDAQGAERMEALARKCLDAMAAPLTVAGQDCRVGLSIGIAIGGGDNSPDQLLVAADAAMYRAKEAGRGRFVLAPGVPG